MSGRFVEIRIELPDTDGDVVALAAMDITSSSEGIAHEAIPAVILKAVENIIQSRLQDGYTEAMPMLNAEFIDVLSASDARLALIDTAMHLPTTGNGQHIETTIPR